MGKLTISMAIFNSYVSHYQRVCVHLSSFAQYFVQSHHISSTHPPLQKSPPWLLLPTLGPTAIPSSIPSEFHLNSIWSHQRYQSLGKAMTIQTWFRSSSTTSQMCSSVRWAKPPVASQRSRGGMFEVGDLHQSSSIHIMIHYTWLVIAYTHTHTYIFNYIWLYMIYQIIIPVRRTKIKWGGRNPF